MVGDSDRLVIATIGLYAHDRISFAIARRPVQKMVILHSKDPRSHDAAKQLQSEYGKEMVDLIEVDPWDFEALLITALDLPNKYPDFTPEYHIGLGTRVMTMALAISALFLGYEMYMVIEDEEHTMRSIKLIRSLPLHPISPQKKLILTVLNDHPDGIHGIRELVRAIRRLKEESTDDAIRDAEISNYNKHVRDLAEWEFVSVNKKERKNLIKITNLGAAILSLKRHRRNIWSRSSRKT